MKNTEKKSRGLKSSEIKKQRIIKQAKIEFSNYTFENASINRIVKAIDMPRGTFYLSFKNKEDLYFHILKEYSERGEKYFAALAEKHNGDIKSTYLELYDFVRNTDDQLIKMILINFNKSHFLKILPNSIDDIYLEKHLDFSRFNFKNEEEKVMLVRLLEVIYIHNLCLADKYFGDSRKKFETQLDIVLKGQNHKCA